MGSQSLSEWRYDQAMSSESTLERLKEVVGPQGWLSETACAVLERDLEALEARLRERGLRLQEELG